MRCFSYFLFENFDADVQAQNPLNPRRFLNAGADSILSHISSFPAGLCSFEDCSKIFGTDILNILISGGVIKREGDHVLFDTPIFLREDAAILRLKVDAIAKRLTDELVKCIPQIRSLCANIRNGFSIELNLYHILCGMIFDGSFFDYLERNNAVTTSRLHASGLDYLSVIYEQCAELDSYSDGLLCSYNRFANSHCALQSFGDANGNRHDFYRFCRFAETGKLPEQYLTAQQLLNECGHICKDEILQQTSNYVKHGNCQPAVLTLLEHFGYVKDGVIVVPVYTPEHNQTIDAITYALEEILGKMFVAELTELSEEINITANTHCVASGEIANELYHILFGSINEQLVCREIVAKPPYVSNEGRYLRSIQLR